MEKVIPTRKFRLIVDYKHQFPEKLYDVANDGYLVHWNRNESVSIKDEDEFEQNVMKLYPGFLQISSVQNFKRLFREYGFDRDIKQNGQLEFSHPLFQRGRRELLSEIKTRRKSFRTPTNKYANDTDIIIPTENNRRYSTRKRRRVSQYSPNSSDNDIRGGGDIIINNTPLNGAPHIFQIKRPNIKPSHERVEGNIQNSAPSKHSGIGDINHNGTNIMKTIADNEFNEHEYGLWLEKQRKLEKARKLRDSECDREKKDNKFWWMYDDTDVSKKPEELKEPPIKAAAPVTDSTVKVYIEDSKTMPSANPCGFCHCCVAISNYVQIFGEVPENIQVYDYVEEVVTEGEEEPGNDTLNDSLVLMIDC